MRRFPDTLDLEHPSAFGPAKVCHDRTPTNAPTEATRARGRAAWPAGARP